MNTYICRDESGEDLFAVEADNLDEAAWEASLHELAPREGATVIPQTEHPAWQDYLDYCRWGGAGGPLGTFVQYLNRRRAQEYRYAENRRTGSTRDQPTLEDIKASALPVVAGERAS